MSITVEKLSLSTSEQKYFEFQDILEYLRTKKYPQGSKDNGELSNFRGACKRFAIG